MWVGSAETSMRAPILVNQKRRDGCQNHGQKHHALGASVAALARRVDAAESRTLRVRAFAIRRGWRSICGRSTEGTTRTLSINSPSVGTHRDPILKILTGAGRQLYLHAVSTVPDFEVDPMGSAMGS